MELGFIAKCIDGKLGLVGKSSGLPPLLFRDALAVVSEVLASILATKPFATIEDVREQLASRWDLPKGLLTYIFVKRANNTTAPTAVPTSVLEPPQTCNGLEADNRLGSVVTTEKTISEDRLLEEDQNTSREQQLRSKMAELTSQLMDIKNELRDLERAKSRASQEVLEEERSTASSQQECSAASAKTHDEDTNNKDDAKENTMKRSAGNGSEKGPTKTKDAESAEGFNDDADPEENSRKVDDTIKWSEVKFSATKPAHSFEASVDSKNTKDAYSVEGVVESNRKGASVEAVEESNKTKQAHSVEASVESNETKHVHSVEGAFEPNKTKEAHSVEVSLDSMETEHADFVEAAALEPEKPKRGLADIGSGASKKAKRVHTANGSVDSKNDSSGASVILWADGTVVYESFCDDQFGTIDKKWPFVIVQSLKVQVPSAQKSFHLPCNRCLTSLINRGTFCSIPNHYS